MHRGEGDEQRMVPMAFGQLGTVVFLALADRDHLGGTALAGNTIRRAVTDLPCRTPRAMQNLLHTVGRVVPEARIAKLDVRNRIMVHRRFTTDAARQMRPNPLAAGRH